MKTIYVFEQIFILFLVIGVGYYAAKKGIIDKKANKSLSDTIIKITLPLLVLNSFDSKLPRGTINTIEKLFLVSLFSFFLSTALGYLFNIRFDKEKKAILIFNGIFSNSGFIGYSIMKIVYGDIGILYASIFGIAFNIFVWTIGVMLFTGKADRKTFKAAIINENMAAIIIGVLLMVFSIPIPPVLKSFCSLVGGMTTPLSMIVIGSILARVDIKKTFKDISLYYASALRLIIVPLITYFILALFKVDSITMGVIVISEAMPAATLCPILAQSYGENYEYASQVVFITTLLSIITIPLAIKALGA